MKKYQMILGLLIVSAMQIHGAEYIPTKKYNQKEFRALLSNDRGMYAMHKLYQTTGRIENEDDVQFRSKVENMLSDYKQSHGNNSYDMKKFKRLEQFKNKEIPTRFEQLKK